MKEIKVSVNTWYVVEGAAGATVINPLTNRAIATVEDGKQASFLATTPYVVASDDSVNVFKAPFNSAPAKLKLLGLLGGGSSTGLPAGYTLLEYIQQPNLDANLNYVNAYIATDVQLSDDMVVSIDYTPTRLQYNNSELYILGNASNGAIVNEGKQFGFLQKTTRTTRLGWGGENFEVLANYLGTELNVRHTLEVSKGKAVIDKKEIIFNTTTTINSTNTVLLGSWRSQYGSSCRLHGAKISKGGTEVASYVPALDEVGAPCMYDIIGKKAFYNGAANEFLYPDMEVQESTYSLRRRAYGQMTKYGLRRLYRVPKGCTLSKDEYAEQNGFKLLVETSAPEEGNWEPQWKENEDYIELEWIAVDLDDENLLTETN